MKRIDFSPDLQLPLDAVTQTFAFLARRGAGKTYGAGKLAEGMLGAGAQVVVLDPIGNWYGLRLAADGKGPGIAIPVFGGEHGDIPLEPGAGALVADLVVDKATSLVLDVSGFRKGQRKEFMTAFAEQLFHRKKTARSALHIIIEEAQVFVPQRVQHGEERLLGAMEDIIKLGRNYGIGVSLLSQRPQAVNKDALNQTECLVVLQTTGPQERKAIEAWVEDSGLEDVAGGATVASAIAALPSLPRGVAFVWSPQWLGILKRVHIGKKRTLDASATPELGGSQAKAAQLAPVELEQLHAAMKDTIAKAAADDPRALKKRIAELERAVAARPAPLAVAPKIVERPMIDDADMTRLEGALGQARDVAVKLMEVAKAAEATWLRARAAAAPPPPDRVRAAPAPAARAPKTAGADDAAVTGPQQRILEALAAFEALGIDRVPRPIAAVYSGASPTSSSFANNMGALRSTGLLHYPDSSSAALTDTGRAVAGSVPPPRSLEQLHNAWYAKLPKPQARIVQALVEVYPASLARVDVAEAAGASATSSSFANNLGALRGLGLVDYPDSASAAATDLLFPRGLR